MSICDKWNCDCQMTRVSIFKIHFSRSTFSIPFSNALLFWQITILKSKHKPCIIWLSWRLKHEKDKMLWLSLFFKTSHCGFKNANQIKISTNPIKISTNPEGLILSEPACFESTSFFFFFFSFKTLKESYTSVSLIFH